MVDHFSAVVENSKIIMEMFFSADGEPGEWFEPEGDYPKKAAGETKAEFDYVSRNLYMNIHIELSTFCFFLFNHKTTYYFVGYNPNFGSLLS